jgi:hypothetical protein
LDRGGILDPIAQFSLKKGERQSQSIVVVRGKTWRRKMAGWITLIRRSFDPGAELAAVEARKSAIEQEMSSVAIDAFLGKTSAVRKFARLEAELKDVKGRVDRLEGRTSKQDIDRQLNGLVRQ